MDTTEYRKLVLQEVNGSFSSSPLRVNSNSNLLQRLRQIASRCTEPTAFDKARRKFTDTLHGIFTENLQAPKHLPLHEIIYFDELGSLQNQLSPSPRDAMHRALTTPLYYLDNSTEDMSNVPDVCTLYQLYMECGKLINLHDWMQVSFTSAQAKAISCFCVCSLL